MAELDESKQELLDTVKQEMFDLGVQLQEEVPEIATILRSINNNLRQFPELVHLLSDDEIEPFYQAYMRMSAVEATATKKKTPNKLPSTDASGNKLADLL